MERDITNSCVWFPLLFHELPTANSRTNSIRRITWIAQAGSVGAAGGRKEGTRTGMEEEREKRCRMGVAGGKQRVTGGRTFLAEPAVDSGLHVGKTIGSPNVLWSPTGASAAVTLANCRGLFVK